jgi:hypothetical protein
MILPALDKIGVDGLCGRHTCRDEIQRRVGSSSCREGQDQLSAGSAYDHLGYRAVPVSGPGNCLWAYQAAGADWLARHPRFRLHFTPTGSSWINQVERWFGYLTAQKIRHGVHKSVQALEADIRAWIENWNQNSRPFTWTKTAEEILDSLAKYIAKISGAAATANVCPFPARPMWLWAAPEPTRSVRHAASRRRAGGGA